jgi:hypothetical protein
MQNTTFFDATFSSIYRRLDEVTEGIVSVPGYTGLKVDLTFVRLLLLTLAIVGICEIFRRFCLVVLLSARKLSKLFRKTHRTAAVVAADMVALSDDRDCDEVTADNDERELSQSVSVVIHHLHVALAEMEELKTKLYVTDRKAETSRAVETQRHQLSSVAPTSTSLSPLGPQPPLQPFFSVQRHRAVSAEH